MRGVERGFLLLTCPLGDPERKPLTPAQLRLLRGRAAGGSADDPLRQMTAGDLIALGYGQPEAEQILNLLEQERLLEQYLQRAHKLGCQALTPLSAGYPAELKRRLGGDLPCSLWASGSPELLARPKIALVGSRDIASPNRSFAWEVGLQAARQGYVLVSGNARGADRLAQTACLEHGGSVICVVADSLVGKTGGAKLLYLSEGGFDEEFSVQRALRRNRLIHALGQITVVAQCGLEHGGTWDGTVKNLKNDWSPVFCFDDGSPASRQLGDMGAELISQEALSDLGILHKKQLNFLN